MGTLTSHLAAGSMARLLVAPHGIVLRLSQLKVDIPVKPGEGLLSDWFAGRAEHQRGWRAREVDGGDEQPNRPVGFVVGGDWPTGSVGAMPAGRERIHADRVGRLDLDLLGRRAVRTQRPGADADGAHDQHDHHLPELEHLERGTELVYGLLDTTRAQTCRVGRAG